MTKFVKTTVKYHQYKVTFPNRYNALVAFRLKIQQAKSNKSASFRNSSNNLVSLAHILHSKFKPSKSKR